MEVVVKKHGCLLSVVIKTAVNYSSRSRLKMSGKQMQALSMF